MIYTSNVKSKRQLTPKIIELTLSLNKPKRAPFIAGQYVPFIIGGKTRIYSMTSSPKNAEELSFCVDITPNGIGSKFVKKLQRGDEVLFNDPLGFFIADERDTDILYIATGAGIAPFKSILPELLADGYKKKATLLFGVHDEDNLFYDDFFDGLAKQYKNFDFVPTLSQPGKAWPGAKGRVTDFLQKNAAKYKKRLIYICGAPAAVADIQDALIDLGFAQKNFRVEIFE